MYIIVGIFSLILPTIYCDCNLEPPLCITETCELLANEIFWQMNVTSDAVADPHAFYCNDGGQSAGFYSPRWRSLMQRALNEKQEGPQIFESAQKLYKSCTDIEQREKRGFSTLFKFIDEIGGFPILDKNWNENSFDVSKAIAILLAKHGIETFMKIEALNNGILIQPVFSILSEKKRILTDAVRFLSKDSPEAIQESLTKAFEFSVNLRSSNLGINQDPLVTTIGNLSDKSLTSFNWNEVFEQIAATTRYPMNDENKVVLVRPQFFMQALPKLLERTPKKVIANYFGLHLIYNYYLYLTPELLKTVEKPSSSLHSYIYSKCVETVYINLDPIPEKLLTKKFLLKESKKELETTFNIFKSALLEFIPKLTFMAKETKERASKMVQKTKLVIGADDELISDVLLEAKLSLKYPGIEMLIGTDLLEDIATVKLAKMKSEILKMISGLPRYSALLTGFDESSNTLVLRSHIVQNPSFIVGAPLIYNAAAIGTYMANEILRRLATTDGDYYENVKCQQIFTDKASIDYKTFNQEHGFNGFRNITTEFFPILYKQYLNFVKTDDVTNTRLPGPFKSYGLSANYIMSYAYAKCRSPSMLNEDAIFLLKSLSKKMMQKC